MLVPPYFPPVNPYSYAPPPISKPVASPGRQTELSSDGSKMETMHPFPSLAEFLENISDSLAGKNRDILEFLEKFESKRVYCLDELKGVSVDEFEAKFGLVWGDARFLKKAINRKIRDIEQARKEG